MASEGTKQDDPIQSPKEPSDEPKKGFMILPPEIRIMVYKHLLKGRNRVTLLPTHYMSLDRVKLYESMAKNNIHMGIMYCNKTIYGEATEILYSANTFFFANMVWGPGDQNWRRVFAWLNRIGPKNRSHLRDLRIQQDSLDGFVQREDGSRESRVVHYRAFTSITRPYPRYEELSLTLPAPRGIVDNISPYVRRVFELFGEDDWRKLKITMDLVSCLVPGVPIFPNRMSVDLPNLVEWFRTHIMGDNGPTIIWRVAVINTCRPADFKEQLHDLGWHVLRARKGSPRYGQTMYTMKKIVGDRLIAAEPYQFLSR
ncbi:hypothetical protein PHISCL_08630 [Aspergillus sclerotialis]|uniref:Uncharacterized protein n=1 Tax=Aspergillus sclerotialis TaxID=2070753 RepID=A0A3A2Z7F1_9EURO|nr:hypothetical protein PHISCL_08630 [Aspergillus sclerotialis]